MLLLVVPVTRRWDGPVEGGAVVDGEPVGAGVSVGEALGVAVGSAVPWA
jgi:hypothetical protein